MYYLLLPFFHQKTPMQGGKKEKRALDRSLKSVCSKQYLRQTEFAFKFCYKAHKDIFIWLCVE